MEKKQIESIPSTIAKLQRTENLLQNEPVTCEIMLMFHTRKIEVGVVTCISGKTAKISFSVPSKVGTALQILIFIAVLWFTSYVVHTHFHSSVNYGRQTAITVFF